jgi:cell division protease FtsH
VRVCTTAHFPTNLNTMTLTDDELTGPAPLRAGAADARRDAITDVSAWLAALDYGVRPALLALGELLVGVAVQDTGLDTAEKFTARCLGVADCALLVDEQLQLNAVARLTIAVALAEWVDEHGDRCEIGPGDHTQPPQWTQTDIGGRCYRHPLCLRAHFPSGTLLDDSGCVIAIETRETMMHHAEVSIYVMPHAQDDARALLDRLADRANELNPYRGRALRATYSQGLSLAVIDLPASATRDSVIVPAEVWAEVDLSVTAVRDRHAVLNAHGLGVRRGVLLCGPPGTGKSAVSAVVAKELVGEFTVIYVEAQAGAQLLTVVVTEAQRLGGPVLLVLEDVDLWCGRRRDGGAGLSELLQAMDIQPEARILTLASTNDTTTLDEAAIRTGRFDSIVEVGYPDRVDAARILAAFIRHLPGGGRTDAAAVAAALPDRTSGSDIREVVRRAVLAAHDGHLTTAQLLAEVGSGRYRATAPDGMYL